MYFSNKVKNQNSKNFRIEFLPRYIFGPNFSKISSVQLSKTGEEEEEEDEEEEDTHFKLL